MNLKGTIWRVVEEFFKSTYVEEIKRKLGIVIEEAINVIQRDDVILKEPIGCRKGDKEMQLEGVDDQQRVFLEEELVSSMMHKD